MPKRKTRNPAASPRALLWLAIAALAIFALGESFLLARSDSGRIAVARVLGIGDRARITQIVGKHLRRALPALSVSADSLAESVVEDGPARVRWRLGLRPGASLLKANHVLTVCAEQPGARVLSGRERLGRHGETIVTLLIGLPGRPTHEIVLVRWPPPAEGSALHITLLAIVLYGFGDDAALAAAFCAMPAPLALAVAPGGKSSGTIFHTAHAGYREVVLHLPLEPLNYPRIDPGSGTLLVTMRPTRIAALVRRYLDQARPVTAVANHMGSLATQDMTVMGAIYHVLRGMGMPFIHVAPVAGAVCKPLAADLGVVYDEPDAIIDSEARQETPRGLERRWKQVLQEARGRDRMEVWLRATPLTRKWLPGALERKKLEGMVLVPVSAVLRRPTGV